MTIAVSGATGHLGRIVVAKLKHKVATTDVRALARNPEKAKDLGVTAHVADYTQPGTLKEALAGVNTLLLISSSEIGQRAAHHAHVIDAARNAGVKRIVDTSLLQADRSSLNLAGEHRETEAALEASGLTYTILRNGWYTENYAGAIPGALASGAFIGCAGSGRVSSATREDFAEAAVVALTGRGHEDKTYELAGDTAWTLADLAAETSRQTGRAISYKNLREAEYTAALKNTGLPEPLAAAIASWDVSASQGALFDESHKLSRLTSRPTTPMATTVAAVLRAQ